MPNIRGLVVVVPPTNTPKAATLRWSAIEHPVPLDRSSSELAGRDSGRSL